MIFQLLLRHSPGMIVLSTFDRSLRYVSPAVKQITGFSEEEYLAMSGTEMVHPEDEPFVGRVVADLRSGNFHQVFRCRMLQKGGGYRWVETTVSGFPGVGTEVAGGYVATVRDISEQKEEEERVALEHRELAAVATLDELTGIGNRRAFNQAMARVANPRLEPPRVVSVMMLDVDHFKRYNDLYGHLPGDECLKTIARTIAGSVRRDVDFAGRYGGEEFVVLMPRTDAAGAEIVARKIQKAIHALAIRHEGSLSEVVTVSIGLASGVMGHGTNSELLLKRADHALYLAKTTGRNCYRVG
jgi:diguanylate cyclase (GGDEF)-like protein/PAS domain S-box-containing protein